MMTSPLVSTHVDGQVVDEVALVAAGDTAETAGAGASGGEIESDNRESVADHAVVTHVPVVAGADLRTGATVQVAVGCTLAHEDAVVVIQPDPGAHQLQQVGDQLRVVDESLIPGTPLRDLTGAIERAIPPATGRVAGDGIELCQLVAAKDTSYHQVALQIELEFLFRCHARSFSHFR